MTPAGRAEVLPTFLKRRRDKSRRSLVTLADLKLRPRPDNEAMIRALCTNAYLGGGTSLTRVLGRYKMYVDTNDIGHSSHLLLDGFWEMWVTEVLADLVRPGMIAVDVGANLGYFTVLLADLVGAAGHVHAFEPNPSIAERLVKSCHVNGYYFTSTVHPDVLGAEEGAAVELVIPAGEPKNAHVVPQGQALPGTSIPLEVRRMDGYPELLDADFVKIDAEGAEQAIWRGMSGIFARKRPMTIVLEFAAARYDAPADFLAEIEAEGFGLEVITYEQGSERRTAAEILAADPAVDQMLLLRR